MPSVTVTLAAIRTRYVERGRPLPRELEASLRADPRPGAKAIIDAIDRRRHENRSEGQRLRKMLAFEQELWAAGLTRVAGVDEAGMSPLAGPVCAAAVVFRPGSRITHVDDSKKLDAKERDRLAVQIKETAAAWAIGWASVDEIDTLNIYWAGLLAMKRAVEGLGLVAEHLLIDARRLKDVDIPQTRIVKGDARSLSIAAASILAKTARDAVMKAFDEEYPGYGFARHKGYPVKEHQAALGRLGACPIHRRSFDPVRIALGLPPLHTDVQPPSDVLASDEPGAGAEAADDAHTDVQPPSDVLGADEPGAGAKAADDADARRSDPSCGPS